jgi:hypothetical protein
MLGVLGLYPQEKAQLGKLGLAKLSLILCGKAGLKLG